MPAAPGAKVAGNPVTVKLAASAPLTVTPAISSGRLPPAFRMASVRWTGALPIGRVPKSRAASALTCGS